MFKYPSVIIVNGQPASGKSYLAKRLADDLQLPLFQKDALKENLFETLGHGGLERSKELGRASIGLLFTTLQNFLHSDLPCIVESNFHPQYDRANFLKLMEKFDFKVVEIYCRAPAEILVKRFEDRARSDQRHVGHADLERLDEFKVRLQEDHSPLNLEGKLLEIDTSDLANFNYEKLLHEAKFWTNVAYRKPHLLIGASFGVIFNDRDEVLLCHRTDKDMWNLPGGGLEVHESPWEGVVREVREETGLEVAIDHFTGIYFRSNTNENKNDQVSYIFRCRPIGGQLTLNEEADQIEYFPVKNLPPNLSPRHVERIMDAFQKSTQTFYKTQE
jgi:ADP-ribose pyrophosphatase YjhB (NUDIX family)/predicted kinase